VNRKLTSPAATGASRDGPVACSVRFDDSRRPISVYTFTGEMTPADLRVMLQHSEEILRHGRHALLMDMRGLSAMSALLRQQAAEWNIANTASLAKHRVGLAMVISDGRERGIVTAIFWHNPPPYPYVITESLEEALAWCGQKLKP
jgi:hypothetical protein